MSTRSHKLGGSAGGVLAYLTDESATLAYYADETQAFTRVWGKAGASLGLERGLTREQFSRLFQGQHPDTGEQLAQRGYKKIIQPDGTVETVESRTPMIDFVYGAPKSVAELYVQASPALRGKLDEKMLAAAHAAHNAMEGSAKLARVAVKTPAEVGARTTKQQGSQTERVTADLIALPVVQYTARHTDESMKRGVPDPQLHVHVPIFTLCKVGDRWLTADEYGAKNKANAKYRDAVFLGELARGLEELGIALDYSEFNRAHNGEMSWEVQGSNRALRRYWSTNNERAWKIRREYEEAHNKPIDEVTLGRVLYETRRHKTPEAKLQDSHPNWQLWWDDAASAGFKLSTFRPGRPIDHNPFRAADTLRLRLLSANGLCKDDATFTEASIRPAIARCAVGLGFSPEELDGCARAMLGGEGRDLVLVEDGLRPEDRKFTTRTLFDAEIDIATIRDHKADRWVDITGRAGTGKSFAVGIAVEALRSQMPRHEVYEGKPVTIEPSPIAEAVKAALAKREHNPDHEQMAAIDAMCEAGKGVEQIIVVSMAASTAERTGVKVKADTWGSVESIVSRIANGTIKPSSRTLVVIEEAGQLDTLRAHKLLQAVGDARIVTLGDERQPEGEPEEHPTSEHVSSITRRCRGMAGARMRQDERQ